MGFPAGHESPLPVTTDWLIFRRAAAELDRALRGARVTDCGLLEDGRFAVPRIVGEAP